MEARLSHTELYSLGAGELAYLGDGVYELCIRVRMLYRGFRGADALVRETTKYVSAPNQARALALLDPLLTEAEAAVVRRGRNKKPASIPKNATAHEYVCATALECLFGYLYLSGEQERIDELCDLILQSDL